MDGTKSAMPEMFFDRGSINQAAHCALKLGARKVFLVSDSDIEKAGWVQRLMEILKNEGIEWIYYPGVSSNTMDFQVEQGVEIYRKNGADVVMAIGGGRSLDTAKGIAIIASNGGRIRDYDGAKKFPSPLPPMMFITGGAGEDFSKFCNITGWLRLQHIPY